jgi:hypothetical protein
MSKFLKGIKGVEKKEPTPQEIDDIAERLHAKLDAHPEAPKPLMSIESNIVVSKPVKQKIVVEPEEPKEALHRLTIDIPKELFEQMKKDSKRKGQTLKGFIVSLIYDFYENKD